MSLVRRIARPLLAAQFVYGGIDQVRHPERKPAGGGPVVPLLAGTSVGPVTLPSDTEGLVRLNGVVMLTAGSLLGTGRLPRLASAVLLASLVPTTLEGHQFWKAEDSETRSKQLVQVLKNAAMAGGLLLAAVDTDGRPSIAWRASHAGRDARRVAKATAFDAAAGTRKATKKARKTVSELAS